MIKKHIQQNKTNHNKTYRRKTDSGSWRLSEGESEPHKGTNSPWREWTKTRDQEVLVTDAVLRGDGQTLVTNGTKTATKT